jgi:hypothetical protein
MMKATILIFVSSLVVASAWPGMRKQEKSKDEAYIGPACTVGKLSAE